MNIKTVLIFLGGVVVGGAAGVLATRSYFRDKAQTEIDETREYYRGQLRDFEEEMTAPYIPELDLDDIPDKEEDTDDKVEEVKEPMGNDYKAIIDNLNRGTYSYDKAADGPIIDSISPDEFADNLVYDKVTFTYFADGTMINEDEEYVVDYARFVGDDIEKKFGEYEEDVAYIRNKNFGIDYEVLFDSRKFSETEYYDGGDDE